ncbi:MAG: type II toxin-antitoxin system HicA family toxin [Gemmatimonadetes bacterium]|nr:type II toxin-antitoxin system HicA family toxin [Gemmatimonadota bacterium]MCY3610480.1 type II toxin-antitoxin system HicA family toxin [Gemmatimonadota bacterium]MYA10797.1 type II toxin-antitoxin system HicA family toxin [Gemmatimonadota bacterium]
MRTKHRRVLERVCALPTPSDIRWRDLEGMLRACGVEIVERSGSRVGLRLGNHRMVVHRPHPRPNTGRATVRDIALFLKAAGVEP